MDQKQALYFRLILQIISMIALVVALFGMANNNQVMISWGIIVAAFINGGNSIAQYRTTRKMSQLVLAILLFGLCLIFIASLLMY